MKLKKGDQVIIIKGKDRKRKGKILKVLPENNKIVIEGLNLKKKHLRPRKEGEKGEIIEMPTPLSLFNVRLLCPRCKKPTRVSYIIRDGKKYRLCKKCKKTFL